jgi:uncharacterized protein YaaW (UPF0174 family)
LNLFYGYSNVEKEEIADQIAMMRSVNFSNVFKINANKTKEKLTGWFNDMSDKITDKLGNDSALNYDFRFKKKEIKEMTDYLLEEKKKIEFKNRETLDRILKEELVKRIESDKFDDKSVDLIDEEKLTKEIIETAANWKELTLENSDDLNSETKAEIISTQFTNILRQKMNEVYNKMSEEEKAKTDNIIDGNINDMSEEKRKVIKESLNIENLSGEVLRKALISSGGPMAAIGVVQLSGIGAYIALTTVMNALFTTVLGITIPFGVYTTATSGLALLAGPIGWLLVFGFGGRQIFKGKQSINRILLVQAVWFSYNQIDYDLKEDSLPDWLPDRKRDKIINLNSQTNELSQGIIKIRNEKKEIANKLADKENLEEQYRKEFEEKQQELNKNNTVIKELQNEVKEFQDKINEVKRNGKEELEEYVDMVSNEISEKEEKIENLREKNNAIINAKVNKEEKLKELQLEKEKLKKEIKIKSKKLSGRITGMLDYFDLFTYEKKAKDDIEKLDNSVLERFMKRLVSLIKRHYTQGEIRVKHPIITARSGKVLEIEYGAKGRIYLIKNGNRYHICRVGNKDSQDQDINWLKNHFN